MGCLRRHPRQGDQFGQDRVIQVASRNREETASRIIGALYEAVMEFSGRTKLNDDVTIVVIKVTLATEFPCFTALEAAAGPFGCHMGEGFNR